MDLWASEQKSGSGLDGSIVVTRGIKPRLKSPVHLRQVCAGRRTELGLYENLHLHTSVQYSKNTIRDGGSTALYTVYTVPTV